MGVKGEVFNLRDKGLNFDELLAIRQICQFSTVKLLHYTVL